MKIKSTDLPENILNLIKNPDPLEGEDIQIEDGNGKLIGVILQPKAYEFFIKKIEEREEELDGELNEPYNNNSKILDELKRESDVK